MRYLDAGVVLSAADSLELTSDLDGRAPQISDLSRPPVCLLDELPRPGHGSVARLSH